MPLISLGDACMNLQGKKRNKTTKKKEKKYASTALFKNQKKQEPT